MAVDNRYLLSTGAGNVIFHRSARAAGVRGKTGKKYLRWTHFLTIFFGLILLFLGVARVYYYLLTCDHLKIKNVEVTSPSPELKRRVEDYLLSRNLGNILICNLDYLRVSLTSLPGIKEVRTEKVLPSTLRVEVFPRIPRFYIHRGLYFLVDEEGQVLRSQSEPEDPSFPVVEDEENFNHAYSEKISLAYQALASLDPAVRPIVRRVILRKNQKLEVELTEDPVRLILNSENFSEKLHYYLANRDTWARLFGPLEYVDLRIEGRVYLKPLELSARDSREQKKEVS